MMATAVVATFGATFLLVWNLLNWLVGHVRWLPTGSMIVTGRTMTCPVHDLASDDPDSASEIL